METNGHQDECTRDFASCLCVKCWYHRQVDSRLKRLGDIEKRLRDADIDIEDLADLIFHRRMPVIEAMIAKRVEEAVKRQLLKLLGKSL